MIEKQMWFRYRRLYAVMLALAGILLVSSLACGGRPQAGKLVEKYWIEEGREAVLVRDGAVDRRIIYPGSFTVLIDPCPDTKTCHLRIVSLPKQIYEQAKIGDWVTER